MILTSARVGGIHANVSRPADFLDDNFTLQTKVIHTAAGIGVCKLLLLGSSCIYPLLAPRRSTNSRAAYRTAGRTNQWYAIARIAGAGPPVSMRKIAAQRANLDAVKKT